MEGPGFLARRIRELQARWQALAGTEYDEATAGLRPDLPAPDRKRLLERMRAGIEGPGGEIAARSRAAALGRIYLQLNLEGKRQFLRLLAMEFDVDYEGMAAALAAVDAAPTPEERRLARQRLLAAVESPRTRLLRRFNALPDGVKFLVDLRADLLPLARTEPLAAALDDDLKSLLTAWFDPDFLQLRRLSWQTAPGALLEKLMAYEAVHPIESWDDLRNRFDHDRRCFAFFHPRMPDEPLIFVEVALTRGLPSNIQRLLDPDAPFEDPTRADTAVFYSISNAQMGLSGIAFGGFLIKRVMDSLAAELPRLKTYGTLSPLPGFAAWLSKPGRESRSNLSPEERDRLQPWLGPEASPEGLGTLLTEGSWLEEPELEAALRPTCLRLAARYLLVERRGNARALDPVAHFHLSNGARFERLNWRGDTSERGLTQSGGIMVNYVYDVRSIEKNHEAYHLGERYPASSSVRNLLKR